VGAPELSALRSALRELGGGDGKIVPRKRPVTEYMCEPISELVAKVDDPVMSRAATCTGVAAILDEGDRRVWRAQEMVLRGVDWTIEPLRS
jgi:hypothetical protein